MWPWSKKPTTKLTSQAIAYLKADLSDEPDDGPTIEFSADDSPVLKSLENGLLVAYVVDQRHGFQYVSHRDLRDDGITQEQMHDIGIGNLAKFAAAKPLRVQPYHNIFAVFVDGNFEASVLLLDDVWTSGFRQFVTGDYLAALPTRDVFAFCDASSKEGRDELLALVRKLENSADHPISQSLYLRVGSGWVRQ
jgi:uncharacterized protein YtpQ (UPF0354 family)